MQRIGRLYRYGQTQRVQVINLQADDSFDSQALSLMLDRVQTMARDMAAVIPESSAALESEILGDLLAMIDMQEILERARTLRIELTESEIATALENARMAQEVEQEILQFADAQQGRIAGGLDARHMETFVVGMLPHVGARLRGRTHQGRVLEIELPEDKVGHIPGLGRRQILHMTAHHDLVRIRQDARDILPLDFESPFVTLLANQARDRRCFDGLYGETDTRHAPEALAVYQVRWQDFCGQMLEEELIPIQVQGAGHCSRMTDEDFAALLLSPLPSAAGTTLPEGFTTTGLEAARDLEIASSAKGHRFPGAVFLTGGLRAFRTASPRESAGSHAG